MPCGDLLLKRVAAHVPDRRPSTECDRFNWLTELRREREREREREKKQKISNIFLTAKSAKLTSNDKSEIFTSCEWSEIINNLGTTTFPPLVGKFRRYVGGIAFCSIYMVFACLACLIENYSIPVILSENAKYRGILESYQGYASLYLYVAQGRAINLVDVFRARAAIHSDSACSIFIWHARSCSRNNRNRKQYITRYTFAICRKIKYRKMKLRLH